MLFYIKRERNSPACLRYNEVRVCCSAILQDVTNLRFLSRAARRLGRCQAASAPGLQNDALVSNQLRTRA